MQKKPALPLFSIALCLLLFLSLSCQSDEEELVERPIHYELPVLYSGVSLGEKESTIIRTEAELQVSLVNCSSSAAAFSVSPSESFIELNTHACCYKTTKKKLKSYIHP
ncbi:MAG: hypothetical protein MI784_12400 [Cytophagales bacterium]|nr:hypothetical protein [Cytophagales bacterium]